MVLSDQQKRAYYDRYGTAEAGIGGFGFGESPFGDIFDVFFGGGAGPRRTGPARGADLRYDLDISLEDVLHGAQREIQFKYLGRCEVCQGTGAADNAGATTCPDCGGAGQVRTSRSTLLGQFVTTTTCPRCGGSGTIIKNPCKACRGRGRREMERKLDVKVPPGVETGTQLRFTGMGEAGERGGPNGDLFVVLGVRHHDVFERHGADLQCETAVSFTQAALGAKLEVASLDGPVELDIPPGTQHGAVIRAVGQGLPRMRGRGRGDLFVTIGVRVPTKLTRKQRELLEAFARAGGEDIDAESFKKIIAEASGG
jgi:molecular chaperone DnaJ